MSMQSFDPDDERRAERFHQFFRPDLIDSQIRTAIGGAWMILPKEKRTVDEVERLIRRMVDRAFRDMREDLESFFGKDTAG
ncbi:MAG: hypothetical protein ABSG53_09640 [Thermoguttaceae bacterium]|jgi:phenylpropionate dioxygenase-like ring-hydroxylating dioxygenase large terminal subunit